jgi:hypothetical protein
MKKLLFVILLITPLFVKSQIKESFNPISKSPKYEHEKLFAEVSSAKQLIYNITASFASFKKNDCKEVSIPIVVIDGVTFRKNNFEDFDYDQIESFKIITGQSTKALFGALAPEIGIIINLKKSK